MKQEAVENKGNVKLDFGASHIESLDQFIRNGQARKVKRLLERTNPKDIPREYALDYASLGRRSGALFMSLKILNPIVRNKDNLGERANPSEIAEYAVALQKIGSINEAENLLRDLDSEQWPQALLYRAFCAMAKWNYKEAVTLIDEYLLNDKITEYQSLVGQINLCASLVSSDGQRANEILPQLIEELKFKKLNLLLGNAYEISAQNNINLGNFEKSLKLLNLAEKNLAHGNFRGWLYVEKWKAVAKIYLDQEKVSKLKEIRALAAKHFVWETVRDCDFYEAIFTKNKALASYLYFGTPFEEYRSKIILKLGPKCHRQSLYLLDPKSLQAV